jgi:hypothetical protein
MYIKDVLFFVFFTARKTQLPDEYQKRPLISFGYAHADNIQPTPFEEYDSKAPWGRCARETKPSQATH